MREYSPGIKAFEAAHAAWTACDLEEAKKQFSTAKTFFTNIPEPSNKVTEICSMIDEGVAAIRKEELRKTAFMSSLQHCPTPEAPPADPAVWAPLPPKPQALKKKQSCVGRRTTVAPTQPNVKTPTDKRSVKQAASVESADTSVADKNDIDRWTTSGEYDRTLVGTVMSMMREGSTVHWDDILGLEGPKEVFRQTVILPALMPDYFTGIRRPASAVLMFGPPGTGKTLLAQAVATERKSTFFLVQVADLASKWRGDAEKLVKLLFEMARAHSPSTIFIDEIDGIGTQRGGDNEHEASRRLKVQLLVEMDGYRKDINDNLLVLAATNSPWSIDEALRRRFEKRLYVDLPELPSRRAFLESTFDKLNLADDVDLDAVAVDLDGYSPADISSVCRQAALAGITRLTRGMPLAEITALPKEQLDLPITNEDIQEALSKVKPSVNSASLQKYIDWANSFGSC